MFDRVFKKKENSVYAEISKRKSKANKTQRADGRPQTAPSSIDMFSSHPTQSATAASKRRSLPDGLLLYRELQKGSGSHGRSNMRSIPQSMDSSSNLAHTSMSTDSSRPSVDRGNSSASSASYELRNPFRSNTSESITTVSMCHSTTSESLADTESPIERIVPTYYPQRTNGCLDAQPHKATMFTSSVVYARATSGDSLEERSCPSSLPTSSGARSPKSQPTGRPLSPPKRHHWSLLKSPKEGSTSTDFLQVQIPSGVMSPPARADRHFWSSKT